MLEGFAGQSIRKTPAIQLKQAKCGPTDLKAGQQVQHDRQRRQQKYLKLCDRAFQVSLANWVPGGQQRSASTQYLQPECIGHKCARTK